MGMNAVVVHYGEEFETIPVDCWFRERNDWALAGPEAHPFIARVVNQHEIRCATAEDVRTLLRVLPEVPRFLDHSKDEPMRVGDGDDMITFQWC